jgi:hypothetical protein
MSETKSEKFQRLRDNRLPKVLHAMGLLENLAGSGYESTLPEKHDLVKQLQDAVDGVAEAFGVAHQAEPSAPPPPQPEPEAEVTDDKVPHTFVADGGSTALSEIKWAHDASRRGDHKLAANRLKRILDAVKARQ